MFVLQFLTNFRLFVLSLFVEAQSRLVLSVFVIFGHCLCLVDKNMNMFSPIINRKTLIGIYTYVKTAHEENSKSETGVIAAYIKANATKHLITGGVQYGIDILKKKNKLQDLNIL